MKWKYGHVMDHHPITVGAIVRGNYSAREYRVEYSGEYGDGGWWIQGRDVECSLSTGWFNDLGKRVGDEIAIDDERREDDVLLVVSEKSPKRFGEVGQTSFSFMDE